MATRDPVLAGARSLLFVPGNRPNRFDKAVASGADLVVLDLEDAVAPGDKPDALAHVVSWLAGGHRAVVRINSVATTWHDDEVTALKDLSCMVMVPKAEDAEALAGLAARLHQPVIALVETAAGIAHLDTVAAASGVERVALGTIDLAAQLGIDPSHRLALDYARGRVVMASAAAGLPPPVDGVTAALNDMELLTSDTRSARDLGFGAKLCVHPRQVDVVHAALRPSEHEIAWANRVLAADTSGGVGVVDGAMVDAPVLARAHAILSRARR